MTGTVTLCLSPTQATCLAEILEHAHATAVNHLVSATLAEPGAWHDRAPILAREVETCRVIKLHLERAVAQ